MSDIWSTLSKFDQTILSKHFFFCFFQVKILLFKVLRLTFFFKAINRILHYLELHYLELYLKHSVKDTVCKFGLYIY